MAETAAARYVRDFTTSGREAGRKTRELDGQSNGRKSRNYVNDATNVSAVTGGAPTFSS